jgi:tRNA pseudouridine(38-40) synthase
MISPPSSTQCQADSPVRTLDRLDVSRQDDLIEVRASARSFLHNQVRSMVGSLKRVGEGGWTIADLKAALDRATARLRPGGAARRAFSRARRLSEMS